MSNSHKDCLDYHMTAFNLSSNANNAINYGNNLKNQGYYSTTNRYEKHKLITEGKNSIKIGLEYKQLLNNFKKDNDKYTLLTGECGSGKSYLILIELILKSIDDFVYKKKTFKNNQIILSPRILIVAPLNSVRSSLQQSLKILWNIMNNSTSEWYIKYGLDKYAEKIKQIGENSNEFISCLERMIINPEKLFHLLFNDKKVEKYLQKIIIDEYHVDNNFYQTFLLMMPSFIQKYYPNVEIVLSSGTPTIKLNKIFHLPSNVTKEIMQYNMTLSIKKINKKKIYTHKIKNIDPNIFNEIKENNEKILIISNSKTKTKHLQALLCSLLNKLKLNSSDVIYVNSDKPLDLEEINRFNTSKIIIASPNSVTQGPTIKDLRLIINFNCYPNLPKLLPENGQNKSTIELYKNTPETNRR